MKNRNEVTNQLELLKTLCNNDEVLKEIESYKSLTGKSLPPIFLACIKNFEIWTMGEPEMFRLKQGSNFINFGSEEFQPNPEVGIVSILKPSQYTKAIKSVYHHEEDIEIIRDKLVIGNIYGGCLLLGVGEDNKDNIYADFIAEDLEKRAIKLADNIFDYFRQIKFFPDPISLSRINVNLDELNKKWGDKFWKVE